MPQTEPNPKAESEGTDGASPPPIRPWPTLAEGPVEDHFVIGVQRLTRRSPRTGVPRDFVILRASPWVNVIATTPEGAVVMVRQYRQAAEVVTLEVPGGMVDPEESPADAAARELLEETGFAGDPPEEIGVVHANPAILDNLCYSYLIRNARAVAPPEPDPGEDIEVLVLPRAEAEAALRDGRITHSLVVAAFLHLHLLEGR